MGNICKLQNGNTVSESAALKIDADLSEKDLNEKGLDKGKFRFTEKIGVYLAASSAQDAKKFINEKLIARYPGNPNIAGIAKCLSDNYLASIKQRAPIPKPLEEKLPVAESKKDDSDIPPVTNSETSTGATSAAGRTGEAVTSTGTQEALAMFHLLVAADNETRTSTSTDLAVDEVNDDHTKNWKIHINRGDLLFLPTGTIVDVQLITTGAYPMDPETENEYKNIPTKGFKLSLSYKNGNEERSLTIEVRDNGSLNKPGMELKGFGVTDENRSAVISTVIVPLFAALYEATQSDALQAKFFRHVHDGLSTGKPVNFKTWPAGVPNVVPSNVETVAYSVSSMLAKPDDPTSMRPEVKYGVPAALALGILFRRKIGRAVAWPVRQVGRLARGGWQLGGRALGGTTDLANRAWIRAHARLGQALDAAASLYNRIRNR